VNPTMNTAHLIVAGVCVVLFALYEAGKTIGLLRRIDAPLQEYRDAWRRQSRALRYKRNLAFHKELYAYGRLSKEELLHTQIYLKSYDNDSFYLGAAIDLAIKIVLPLSVFWLGSMLAVSNNLFGIASRSADTLTAGTFDNIVELFQLTADNTNVIMLIAIAVFVVGLVNAACKAARKQKIQLHLLLVEAAMKQASEETKA